MEEDWCVFKKILMDVEDKYVPFRKAKTGSRKKSLWMTRKARKSVAKKHRMFNKYKDARHPAYTRSVKEAM